MNRGSYNFSLTFMFSSTLQSVMSYKCINLPICMNSHSNSCILYHNNENYSTFFCNKRTKSDKIISIISIIFLALQNKVSILNELNHKKPSLRATAAKIVVISLVYKIYLKSTYLIDQENFDQQLLHSGEFVRLTNS